MSPNYPEPYHHNAFCIWTITVHPRAQIDFTVTNLDLERHHHCAWDYIEVRTRQLGDNIGGGRRRDGMGRGSGVLAKWR